MWQLAAPESWPLNKEDYKLPGCNCNASSLQYSGLCVTRGLPGCAHTLVAHRGRRITTRNIVLHNIKTYIYIYALPFCIYVYKYIYIYVYVQKIPYHIYDYTIYTHKVYYHRGANTTPYVVLYTDTSLQ